MVLLLVNVFDTEGKKQNPTDENVFHAFLWGFMLFLELLLFKAEGKQRIRMNMHSFHNSVFILWQKWNAILIIYFRNYVTLKAGKPIGRITFSKGQYSKAKISPQ